MYPIELENKETELVGKRRQAAGVAADGALIGVACSRLREHAWGGVDALRDGRPMLTQT